MASEEKEFTFSLDVPFPTASEAEVVRNTLAVDPELQPQKVTKSLTVQGTVLRIEYAATEAKLLRACVSANMDLLALATKTVEQFGPPPVK